MKGKNSYLESQIKLKLIYSDENNSTKKKLYREYISLLKKSAYLGFAEAQFELGLQYEDVFIFGKNPNFKISKCIYWYKKACLNGVSDACNNLAIILENEGYIKEAIINYKKAIRLGNKKAIKNLKKSNT